MILTRFRRVFVDACDTCFVDSERPASNVEVRDLESNLCGGSQPGEEPKLVIVALRLAPIAVDGSDQRLGLLNPEGIDDGAFFLLDTRALETQGRVVLLGVIAIAELEGTSQYADRIVVSFLAPLKTVRATVTAMWRR